MTDGRTETDNPSWDRETVEALTSQVVHVAGRAISVIERGSGHPVVFLHGIPTFSYVWRDVLPIVARRHRCLAPDLLGFGHSGKPRDARFGVAAQADVVAALLDALDVRQVAVVAHDFGALVAAELLAREPTRVTALVLSNTSLRRAAWKAGPPLSLLRLPFVGELAMLLARSWMLKLALRVYVTRDERLTPDVMAQYWWPFAHGFKRVLLALARERWGDDAAFARWRESLRSYPGPVLVVWGPRDPTFGRELADLLQLMPAACAVPLPDANHFLQEDEPETLGRLILDFLAQRPK